MKRIVFPTDFSDTSRNALKYAIALAADLKAKVDIVTVYHIPMIDVSHTPPELIHRMTDEKRIETERELKALYEAFDCPQLGDCHALYGVFTPQEITDFVADNKYDLIVMGTRSEHGRLDRMIGSVTTQTMMNATVPVLAVPADASYKKIGQIAYATDFRPEDGPTVSQLMEFAGFFKADIHFVHVETHPEVGEMDGVINVADYPVAFADFSIVNSASIQEGLDRFVQDLDVDLLAMFIPRRRLWERLFHTSLTRKMTYNSTIPLLVFHQ
ncbi:MAG: universal stress protein [Saprospiraceae bacterium]|nr:universal stress protein [Saprospiraceae bacterium]